MNSSGVAPRTTGASSGAPKRVGASAYVVVKARFHETYRSFHCCSSGRCIRTARRASGESEAPTPGRSGPADLAGPREAERKAGEGVGVEAELQVLKHSLKDVEGQPDVPEVARQVGVLAVINEALERHLDCHELGELEEAEATSPVGRRVQRLAQLRVHVRRERWLRRQGARQPIEQQRVVHQLIHGAIVDRRQAVGAAAGPALGVGIGGGERVRKLAQERVGRSLPAHRAHKLRTGLSPPRDLRRQQPNLQATSGGAARSRRGPSRKELKSQPLDSQAPSLEAKAAACRGAGCAHSAKDPSTSRLKVLRALSPPPAGI